MARGHRVFARPGKKIDFKQWTSILALGTSVNTDELVQGASLAFGNSATILRIRGAVQASFDSTNTAGDDITLTWALGMVSTDAFAAGLGSMPDPAGEPEYPWLWWGTMFLHSELTVAPPGGWGTLAQRLEVDSKAMRKVKPGQSLVWLMQATGQAGTPLTNIDFMQTRVLIGF